MSLSQSTEVTVAESDKDAINPRANLLPVAINSPHLVRRTQDGRLDAIQSRALIGRKSACACSERHVNSVFVSGPRARVVVVERGQSFVECRLCCKSCCCVAEMPKTRRISPASGRDSSVNNSESGGGAGTDSSPTVDFVTGVLTVRRFRPRRRHPRS